MRQILKWVVIALGAVVALLLVAAAVLYVIGGAKFAGPDGLRAEAVVPAADSAGLALGEHLTATHYCALCHGPGLGGQTLADVPPFRAVASNLTSGRGGVGARLDAAGWERAIRHGIGADGRGLLIMPAELYVFLSDEDIAAMIGYLQSLPPVDNELPATAVKPLGRIIAGTGGLFPTSELVDHGAPHTATTPPVGATREYGEYRASTMCSACHGADMRGAQPPDPASPPAPSLVPAGHWTLDQFRTLLRTGQTPARQVDPQFMPIDGTRHLTDAEMEAIWLFLGSLPAEGAGPAVTQ